MPNKHLTGLSERERLLPACLGLRAVQGQHEIGGGVRGHVAHNTPRTLVYKGH